MKNPTPYPILGNRPIDQWKVTELREELKKRKLVTKGLKEDLIKRLDEAIRSENDSAEGNVDNGFDSTPQPEVETEVARTEQIVSETTSDMMDHDNNRNEVDGGMDKAYADDTIVPLGEGKVQYGESTVTDSARDEGIVIHAPSTETRITVNESVESEVAGEGKAQDGEATGVTDSHRDEMVVSEVAGEEKVQDGNVTGATDTDSHRDEMVVSEVAGEEKFQDGNVTGATDSASDEELVVHTTSTETSITVNESVVSEISGEEKVQDGNVTGTTDSARDEELVVHTTTRETSITVNESVVSEISGEEKVQDGNVTDATDSASDEELVVHTTSTETSITVNESVVSEISREEKVQDGNVTGTTDSARDEELVAHTTSRETSITVNESEVSEIPGEGKVQDGEVTGAIDSAGDQMVVHATYMETNITVNEGGVSEIAVNVQESQNNDPQNERGDLKFQMESEEVKPLHEDVELNASDPNNQVSEVSTVLGFQVKYDSISSDCVSPNEKNELKDNIIADNVKLELDVKPEMVQPSSSNVLTDGGTLHPMDVEAPHESEVPVAEREYNKDANAEMIKKNDIADVVSSEKLNLDRSSGDDSMEDDALESKQIDSKYNSDEVGERSEKTEVPLVKEEAPVDIMQDDIPMDKKDFHDEIKKAPTAPSVKRKVHDQEAVVNNETSKRQRRWNSESLKVPEPQSSPAPSTTPKDRFPSATMKRNFSRSDSTASEDALKERVVPPSPKPPTNSLRIDRFLRPFTLKAVQELLGKTGNVTSFWMDQIKTHCYVTYSSVEEALETRNAVYNLQWPPNGGRLLVAEFVEPQEVKMRAEAAPQSPATPASTGPTVPPGPPALQPQPPSRQQVQRQQLPPPPPLPSLPPPPPLSNPPPAREQRIQLPPPPPPPEKVDPPIVTLDDLFRKTKATPRIYYLPLSDEQVAEKLKAQGKSTKQ